MIENRIKDGNVEIYADLNSPPANAPNGTLQTLNKSASLDKDYLINSNQQERKGKPGWFLIMSKLFPCISCCFKKNAQVVQESDKLGHFSKDDLENTQNRIEHELHRLSEIKNSEKSHEEVVEDKSGPIILGNIAKRQSLIDVDKNHLESEMIKRCQSSSNMQPNVDCSIPEEEIEPSITDMRVNSVKKSNNLVSRGNSKMAMILKIGAGGDN